MSIHSAEQNLLYTALSIAAGDEAARHWENAQAALAEYGLAHARQDNAATEEAEAQSIRRQIDGFAAEMEAFINASPVDVSQKEALKAHLRSVITSVSPSTTNRAEIFARLNTIAQEVTREVGDAASQTIRQREYVIEMGHLDVQTRQRITALTSRHWDLGNHTELLQFSELFVNEENPALRAIRGRDLADGIRQDPRLAQAATVIATAPPAIVRQVMTDQATARQAINARLTRDHPAPGSQEYRALHNLLHLVSNPQARALFQKYEQDGDLDALERDLAPILVAYEAESDRALARRRGAPQPGATRRLLTEEASGTATREQQADLAFTDNQYRLLNTATEVQMQQMRQGQNLQVFDQLTRTTNPDQMRTAFREFMSHNSEMNALLAGRPQEQQDRILNEYIRRVENGTYAGGAAAFRQGFSAMLVRQVANENQVTLDGSWGSKLGASYLLHHQRDLAIQHGNTALATMWDQQISRAWERNVGEWGGTVKAMWDEGDRWISGRAIGDAASWSAWWHQSTDLQAALVTARARGWGNTSYTGADGQLHHFDLSNVDAIKRDLERAGVDISQYDSVANHGNHNGHIDLDELGRAMQQAQINSAQQHPQPVAPRTPAVAPLTPPTRTQSH